MLLNIGPMGNGKFDPKDVAILDGVGAWMKVNGESIHGTERTPLPVQAWGESTRKGNTLYLHVFTWPTQGRIVVGGLKTAVKRAYLLSDPAPPCAVQKLGDWDVVVRAPPRRPTRPTRSSPSNWRASRSPIRCGCWRPTCRSTTCAPSTPSWWAA